MNLPSERQRTRLSLDQLGTEEVVQRIREIKVEEDAEKLPEVTIEGASSLSQRAI